MRSRHTLAAGLTAILVALGIALSRPVSAKTKLLTLATRPPWVGRRVP